MSEPSKETQEQLIDVVAKALREIGWNPLVIGGLSIIREPADPQFVYHFRVRFTGAPPKEAT
jgi:hypothetical protein